MDFEFDITVIGAGPGGYETAIKAAQMGKWIRKGKLGRHKWIWVVRWLLRVGLFLLFAVALYLWHAGYLNCELLEMLPVFYYS